MTTKEAEICAMALQAKMRVEELEATQTRWVPCSERMPPSEEVVLCTLQNEPNDPLYIDLIIFNKDGEPKIDGYGNILAWLENVPEFVPEAKP